MAWYHAYSLTATAPAFSASAGALAPHSAAITTFTYS